MKEVIMQATLVAINIAEGEYMNLVAQGYIPKRTEDGVNYLIKKNYTKNTDVK